MDLADLYAALCAPFPVESIMLKPGVTNQEKTRAIAMPYADMRVYQHRLDTVVGPDNWQSSSTIHDRGVVCALTILGVTKSGIGDYPRNADDANPATSAEAQAFKRACAAFGIGRYLYDLPEVWTDYDRQRRQIVHPTAVVRDLYRRARLPLD